MRSVKGELELKFYEKLGVRKFKDFLVNYVIVFACAPIKFLKVPINELKNKVQNIPSNYFMKKRNGIKDLQEFKKEIYCNTIIHIIAMIASISIMANSSIILGAIFILINTYCLMLQRYNYIRINNTINKFKNFEEKQRVKLKEEIKDNTEDHYIIHINLKKFEKKQITIDEFLNLIPLDDLKKLRNKLIKLQDLNERILTNSFYNKNESYRLHTKVKKKI